MNLRDLASWYPIMPGTTLTDTVTRIRDAHIIITYPASDLILPGSIVGNAFSVVLTSIAGASATVKITIPTGIENRTVTVYTDVNSIPAPGTDYIISDGSITASNLALPLNPMCVRCYKRAPVITWTDRGSVSSKDSASFDGQVSSYTSWAGSTATSWAFRHGNNVDVTAVNDASASRITFNGVAGAGKGIVTSPAYSDVSKYSDTLEVGIPGINGIKDPSFTGTDSIAVTFTGGTLTLSVREKA